MNKPFVLSIWLAACGFLNGALVLQNDADSTITAGTTGGSMHLVLKGDPVLATDVLGFQVAMLIQPDAGTIGTLQFDALNTPSANYLLQGVGQGMTVLPSTQLTLNDRVRVFDIDSAAPLTGANVLANAEFNLAEIVFAASNDASGVFGLYVIDQPGNRTEWTTLTAQEMKFDGVPADSLPVRIGSITAVPEPSPVMMLGITFALCCAYRIGNVGRLIRQTQVQPK